MKYTQVVNLQWANAEHTAINCDVDFDDLREELVPFTAVANGDYEHTHQIFAECLAGQYGVIAEYVPSPPYIPTAEDNKQTATKLLQQTDWTTVSDVADPALSNPYLMNQADFFAYRSALRQIAVNPVEGIVAFPVKPVEQWS
jgi:hypothetical protein